MPDINTSHPEKVFSTRETVDPAPGDHARLGDDGDIRSGSIVFIDPATSGIIGTLNPASPDVGATHSHDPSVEDVNTSDVTADLSDQDRRRPTYSYRLSMSDVSLRTFGAARPTPTIGGSVIDPSTLAPGLDIEGGRRQMRSSMADDASFWTARGTIRSNDPEESGEVGREVLVAYVQADTSLEDLFPSQSRVTVSAAPAASPNTHLAAYDSTVRTVQTRMSTLTAGTDSPFPSRILHLFPRLSNLPRNLDESHARAEPEDSVASALSLAWPSADLLDPSTILAMAQTHAEAAFWRLVMPGIGGLYRWTDVLGTAYTQLSTYWPRSLDTDLAPLFIDSSVSPSAFTSPGQRDARLYSEETLYTLRLPGAACSTNPSEAAGVDIGPTAKPVWIRKRAALPVFDERELGWGKQGLKLH